MPSLSARPFGLTHGISMTANFYDKYVNIEISLNIAYLNPA